MENIQLLSMAISFGLLLIVLQLIRKKYLREQYSLLWLLFCLIIFVLSLSDNLVEKAASLIGVKYAPALLFLIGILLCLTLILHLTVVVSRLTERVIRLTQELGITKHELEQSQKGTDT